VKNRRLSETGHGLYISSMLSPTSDASVGLSPKSQNVLLEGSKDSFFFVKLPVNITEKVVKLRELRFGLFEHLLTIVSRILVFYVFVFSEQSNANASPVLMRTTEGIFYLLVVNKKGFRKRNSIMRKWLRRAIDRDGAEVFLTSHDSLRSAAVCVR